MKKNSIIPVLILLISIFQINNLQAQDDLFSYMEEHLSSNEKDQIDRAKSYISKGDKLSSQISKEENSISKHRGKKKYEKKSVDAKKLRIKQALFYEKGLTVVYDVYGEKVASCVFYYDDDEAKVQKLQQDATDDFNSGKRKLKTYNGVSEKALKKKHKHSTIKSNLETSLSFKKSAIRSLISGYKIFVAQEEKKEKENAENEAWNNAISDDSIEAYRTYLSDYSNGKHASEARNRIAELEEAVRKKQAEDERLRSLENLKFHIQIAASRKQLSKYKIRRIYRGKESISMKNYDNWYKYSIGTYETYEAAHAFLDTLKITGAFVVAYLNGSKIHIVEAIRKKSK